jgi:hypothetical protein
MSHRYLAGCCLAALSLTPLAAQATPKPAALFARSDVRPVAAACSFGTHLDISGFCVDSMDYSRRCPPGDFAVSFPNGNGYRCLPAEWMQEPGWLGSLFQ